MRRWVWAYRKCYYSYWLFTSFIVSDPLSVGNVPKQSFDCFVVVQETTTSLIAHNDISRDPHLPTLSHSVTAFAVAGGCKLDLSCRKLQRSACLASSLMLKIDFELVTGQLLVILQPLL